jgi:two-component system LytT family response regulator
MMTKYKAVLIDDEPLALQRLEKLLSPFRDIIEVLAKVDNGADAIKKIDELKPDVIFLDIQMPEYNGFEVLERIDHQPFVIFSTAYDEYALRAFEANSIDYLLKPVESARLKKAIDKLKTIKGGNMDGFQSQLKEMLMNVRGGSSRIQVKKGDKIKLLAPEDIFFFTAEDKYTRVNTFNNSFLIDKSLSALESELGDGFIRIHRKAIVNINHIDEIFRMFKGSFKVSMKDEQKSELPVSRSYKHRLGI